MGDVTDWGRVAEPQPDDYGLRAAKDLAMDRYGWEKTWPEEGDETWLDGAVRIENVTDVHEDLMFLAGDLLHEAWPELHRDLRELLQFVEVEWYTETEPNATGCSCGPLPGDRVSMQVMVKTSGAVGLLEGVIHEYAHNLMKFHGISLYHWERHLANPEATQQEIDDAPPKGTRPQGPTLFDSPVVRDRQRPMGACVSAWYSYVFVGQLLTKLVEAGILGADEVVGWLEVQRGRVVEGLVLVREHVEYDETGEAYFGSLLDWGDRVVAEADLILGRS